MSRAPFFDRNTSHFRRPFGRLFYFLRKENHNGIRIATIPPAGGPHGCPDNRQLPKLDGFSHHCRLYKYPYHEQLMIYAQRPDATACAEYDLWNKRMGRYIRRGAKGIALIDHSGDAPRLRYVFDVADTRGAEHSRNPYLWEFRPEHEQVVSDSLELQYDIRYPGSFSDLLEQISSVKVTEYFLAHEQDLLDIVDGSYLEQYHDYDKGVAFLNAATVSTTYMLLSRCGLAENAHFGPEDFMPVFDFNTSLTPWKSFTLFYIQFFVWLCGMNIFA